MFRGTVLNTMYYSWESYRKAWNDAVEKGLILDTKGRKVTKIYN